MHGEYHRVTLRERYDDGPRLPSADCDHARNVVGGETAMCRTEIRIIG